MNLKRQDTAANHINCQDEARPKQEHFFVELLVQIFQILENDPSEKENIIGDKRYENEVKEMKRAMKQYVENGRSTPGEKVSNDTKNSWNQVKIFMQEEEGI